MNTVHTAPAPPVPASLAPHPGPSPSITVAQPHSVVMPPLAPAQSSPKTASSPVVTSSPLTELSDSEHEHGDMVAKETFPQVDPESSANPSNPAVVRRRAARKRGYGRIELWLEDALDRAFRAPSNPDHFYCPLSEEPSRADMVECTVRITEREYDGPNHTHSGDWSQFTLCLDVHVPICCGFLLYYTTSPTVTLAMWNGSPLGIGPMWMDYSQISSLKFWHTRAEVVDLVKELVASPLNARVSGEMQEWADALTRGSSADIRNESR
ncbi:hypothetical protein NMY22_g10587 [Coprinellus aureogranulatus]|nr:hypothetical protein NMY22_g10587 [Coprinellus aureogranulatus]